MGNCVLHHPFTGGTSSINSLANGEPIVLSDAERETIDRELLGRERSKSTRRKRVA